MSDSILVKLPGRFTLPAIAELKVTLDAALKDTSEPVLDGSAVTAVDTAALQFILLLQKVSRQHGAPDDNASPLSVLHAPSGVLQQALQDIGALERGTGDSDTTD